MQNGRLALAACSILAMSGPALARPYRAMVTRTAESTKQRNLEVGLRYQGFLLGFGRPAGVTALPWHQVAAHARYGILDTLEIETQLEVLIEKQLGSPYLALHLGDIPIGLQWTFIDTQAFAMGVFARVTIPTGPGDVDLLPPTVSDGTWDLEATLLAELRFTRNVRLMLNGGFLYHGVRRRTPRPDFDVPEGIRYDAALTANLNRWLLVALEVVGRSFFRPDITPAWTNNQHLVEVIPGARFEIVPKLVLEAAVGIAVTQDLQQMYLLRPLVGLTYEFWL
jgi:hypothetical protein